MNSTDILNTINGTLDILAKKLGVAVDKIYPILLKQVKVSLMQDIFIILVSIIAIFSVIKIIKWVYKKFNSGESYSDDSEVRILASIFGIIIIIIFLVVIITECLNCFQIIVNPDYYIFSHYIQPLLSK